MTRKLHILLVSENNIFPSNPLKTTVQDTERAKTITSHIKEIDTFLVQKVKKNLLKFSRVQPFAKFTPKLNRLIKHLNRTPLPHNLIRQCISIKTYQIHL